MNIEFLIPYIIGSVIGLLIYVLLSWWAGQKVREFIERIANINWP